MSPFSAGSGPPRGPSPAPPPSVHPMDTPCSREDPSQPASQLAHCIPSSGRNWNTLVSEKSISCSVRCVSSSGPSYPSSQSMGDHVSFLLAVTAEGQSLGALLHRLTEHPIMPRKLGRLLNVLGDSGFPPCGSTTPDALECSDFSDRCPARCSTSWVETMLVSAAVKIFTHYNPQHLYRCFFAYFVPTCIGMYVCGSAHMPQHM